jgi:hypothetical protein
MMTTAVIPQGTKPRRFRCKLEWMAIQFHDLNGSDVTTGAVHVCESCNRFQEAHYKNSTLCFMLSQSS